ncbi:LPXTG cell wall anchor domain-containing protein [Micromonospora sp. NPDC005367]|uniref:LPXTG cell wall anchor domain-containing protein n=1 Tax=Micromonospora sp. NPDC005367 TaxID=3155590 RepID=UPI00339E4D23
MNRLSFRRAVAVAAGALLGLGGVATFAAPASAHHSELKVTAECDSATGEWVTTWTVGTVAPEGVRNYKLIKADAVSNRGEEVGQFTIDGIQAGTVQGKEYPYAVGEPVVGQARLANDVTEASLTVRAKWDNGFKETKAKSTSIKFSESCDKVVTPPPATASPKATVTADCTGDVAVKLENGEEATKAASFTVTGADGFSKKATVEPGEDKTVEVPAKNAGKITVTEEGQQEPLFDDKPAAAEDCVKPGEPSGGYLSTCDELIFEISNPDDGKTVTITFTPNKGEAKTLTVEPGKTGTVAFKAEEGLTVTPTGEGLDETEPIAWEKPEECATPAPGQGGGEDEPTLPLTGAATSAIIAGAAVLLAAGVVLFLVARRRKVRFTA